MAKFECPGSKLIKQPVPEYVKCPNCGGEIEIWSDEFTRKCPSCQKEVTKVGVPTCADWCPYVKQCLGEELYERYMKQKLEQEERSRLKEKS